MHNSKASRLFVALSIVAIAGISMVAILVAKDSRGSAASAVAAGQDMKKSDQAQKILELRKRIAGMESKPAPEVFKNITIFKTATAEGLLRIMDTGFSKALGVTCNHCHVLDHWERDDKKEKQIAREMAQMLDVINNEYVKKIKHLGGEARVNCTTCHRGETSPALSIP